MAVAKLSVLLVLLAALMLLAAACGDDDSDDATATPTNGTSAVGPGISIAEALRSTLDQPLLVNGTLVIHNDEVRLCEALAESYPPQCGGESLLIVGADIQALRAQWDLVDFEGTTWSDEPVQLLGEVEDGVLTISGLSSA